MRLIFWKRPILTFLFVCAYEMGMFNVEYWATSAMLGIAAYMIFNFCLLEVEKTQKSSKSRQN